jgi:alkyldihydroxyacetonephosphate synthase
LSSALDLDKTENKKTANSFETPFSSSSLKPTGWGYRDTKFVLNSNGVVEVSGDRYKDIFPAARVMPNFRPWIEENTGIDINVTCLQQVPDTLSLPEPVINQQFIDAIANNFADLSWEGDVRLYHAHGHTNEDVFRLRVGSFDRLPDVVVWPGCHDHVVAIMAAATAHNVAIIPFGGGTR